MVPVPGGEVWAEDTGGDGTPVVLVTADWSTAGIWTPLLGADHMLPLRAPDQLAKIIAEQTG